MIHFILKTLIGGIAVLAIPHLVPGIKVEDYRAALKLVVTMTLINFIQGILFWWLIFPFKLLTLGVGTLIINAIVLDISSDFIRGVSIDSFRSAFFGSLYLSILWTLLLWILL